MRLCMVMVPLFIGFSMLLQQAAPVSAAPRGCSFRKTVQQGGYVFDVASRPADGCGVQIIQVIVRRSGKQLAIFKADVDFMVEDTWAVDMDGDGKPELAVASRSSRDGSPGTFDVYWLEDKALRRASLPADDEGAGYLGHDRFRLDNGRIVRSFPVYRIGDPDNRPSGGMRTMRYGFHDGKLNLNVKSDDPAATAAQAAAPASRKARSRQVAAEGYPQAAPPEFFLPQAPQPVAKPAPKAPAAPLPSDGYPRAAPPDFFLQKDSHQ